MLNRLLGIIYILMNKGTIRASELAQRFEVSTRTIYRDIEELGMAGIPIYTKKGKNGGICITDTFVLNKMLLSQEEKIQILAALSSLEKIGVQKEHAILQKLEEFFQVKSTNWVAIDFSDWSGKRTELFEQLKQAILCHRVLEFDYYGQRGTMSHRLAEPIQLLFKEYTWYLWAYCRIRQSMRLFKVMRMKRVIVTKQEFLLQRETYFEQTDETKQEKQQEERLEVVVKIDATEAYRIYDRFEEEEITKLEDGSFLIRIQPYPIDDWIYGMILSFGATAEILEPKEIREEMKLRLKQMSAKYENQKKFATENKI